MWQKPSERSAHPREKILYRVQPQRQAGLGSKAALPVLAAAIHLMRCVPSPGMPDIAAEVNWSHIAHPEKEWQALLLWLKKVAVTSIM